MTRVPLGKYLLCVGSMLLAILFMSDSYFGEPTRTEAQHELSIDKTIFRISSDRKWPEKIVFDTTQPIIVPAPTQAAAIASAPAPAAKIASTNAQSTLEAFAETSPLAKEASRARPRTYATRKLSRPRNSRLASYPTAPAWPPGW